MGLRDQPVLDQYQDRIFRLPLNMSLLILGPPGTGKTTTLIRRLGQKLTLDESVLEPEELRLVKNVDATGDTHKTSWIMFTPTTLLRGYLKEAFAREGVPASDTNITTWDDYRRDLARNTFGVLRNAADRGIFVMKEGISSLDLEAIDSSSILFSDFYEWQRDVYLRDLRGAARSLETSKIAVFRRLGRRLTNALERVGHDPSLWSVFNALAIETANVRNLVSETKKACDDRIDRALNLQLNRNRQFLDDLARYVDDIEQTPVPEGDEDDEEFGSEDDDEPVTVRTGTEETVNVYRRTVRAEARAAALGRRLGSKSRSKRVAEWLGDRTLPESERVNLGEHLVAQIHARRFANSVRRYMDGIPRRYRAFRRRRQSEGKWYTNAAFRSSDIHPLEVDIVLLGILRAAQDFLSRASTISRIEEPMWSYLTSVRQIYRNQVFVDEATDFSPVQLGCMVALAHPSIRSFFACGDFNQRLTTSGARSEDDFKWACPDITVEEINVSYRQTKQLSELSVSIIKVMGGVQSMVDLPVDVDVEGVKPILLEGGCDDVVVKWLANRICEIDNFVERLPSTAVFVNSEANVLPLAEALDRAMVDHNIKVVACPMGQALGQDNDVRVFDIQHIKGLEFEAVFFVAVDRLAAERPTLFGKYLYVGTSRAATYLGITCENALPEAIEGLRKHFDGDWSLGVRA